MNRSLPRSHPYLALGSAAVTLAIAAAGCGSSSSSSTVTTPIAPKTVATKPAVHHSSHPTKHHAKPAHPAAKHTTTTPAPAQPVTQTQTTPPPPPPPKTTPSGTACIPQGKNAGDADTDNMGAPSDGDGCV